MSKYVYYFSDEDTLKQDKDVLGGKGFGLISLKKLGISVPPAFVITTQACKQYHNGGGDFFVNLRSEIDANIQKLEKETGKQFGGHDNPLLVSVRSGAAVSMPGMMDTILNLGLNDDTVEALASKSGNTRFALDSYRRFIQMFSNVAMGLDHKQFEQVLEKEKEEQGVEFDYQLSEESLIRIILQYKGIYRKELGQGFPQDVRKQLELGIKAVFDSWNNDRAKSYRRINNIQGLTGTAVNIQAMVFGNLSDNSGTGVIFTRNPNNGKKGLYGEYLINAQGEDVVAGIRTPKDVSSLGDVLPGVYKELVRIAEKLEEHFRDMQDIEFTVENGKLYILQTRSGKRNADAAINIAVAMEREDLITKEEALLRIDAKSLDQLLHPRIKNGYENKVLGQGLPASPGAVTGKISFSPVTSREYFENGESVIMVRNETTPEDIEDMNISAGILTARGGMTSHAAVVGRGMGKCCVVGCKELLYEDGRSKCKIGDYVLSEGDVITLDGGSGKILLGQVEKVQARMNDNFETIMEWADDIRTLKVRINADNPEDSKKALEMGAEGIGLCRTEHMFFGDGRIDLMREMILADNKQTRVKVLQDLMPFQKKDFAGILKAMDGLPVTIRLIDPPLHEFLPRTKEDMEEFCQRTGWDYKRLRKKVETMEETNPMLGHRGCRLGIVYPEIIEMQVKAILEAVVELKQQGYNPRPEIEVPLVQNPKELEIVVDVINKTAEEAGVDKKDYILATMIELPRACVVADKLVKQVDLLSFGTNDLTQTTMGISRDDGNRFIGEYVANDIFAGNPFQQLDLDGVGVLIQVAVLKSRKVKPEVEIGVCGEHGGDPFSIEFFQRADFDFVSCSLYRLPIARLAAAQAAIKYPESE